MEKENFFSKNALARFVASQNSTLSRVICHLWINRTDPEKPFEVIDNIQLEYEDHPPLVIGCNEEGDGLDVIDFNLEESAKHLAEEFGNKIKIVAVDASGTKMWAETIGKVMTAVKLTKSGDYYKADALVLEFGNEKREISISPMDGLILDYFEE